MRFQTKLLLVFLLLLMAVVGSMAFFNYQSSKRLLGDVEANLREIVNTVHFSTRQLSSEKGPDREFLEKFIREFKAKKGVKEVSIVSNHQEVIASSNPKRIGRQVRALSGKEIVVEEQFGARDSASHASRPQIRYEVRVPLIRDDRVIGLVQTSIVMNDFRYLVRQAFVKNISIALTALIFAFGASFFILNRLNKPIRQLGDAAGKIAQGDLTVSMAVEGRDEMGRLAASFNAMTLKLAEQKSLEDRLRQMERRTILAELASNMAHEIRNPLNLINLTADHLGERFRPEDGRKREDYLGLVASLKSEVKHLNHVVGDFLALGRPTRLNKARFRLAELVGQVEVMVRQQLTVKGIRFRKECPSDLWVTADQEQLRLVILNLMLNAIQAVPPGGRIAFSARLETSEGVESERIAVAVKDNGVGIDPDHMDLIFEPYFSKREGGTGLGLSLVRRIVDEHGGRVRAANNPEGGASLEFTLPVET